MRKKFKALIVFLVALQMVFGGMVNIYASEDIPEEPAGQPNVTVVNGPIFEVEAGQENKINLEVKNLSSSVAQSVMFLPKFVDVTNNPLIITTKSGSTNVSTVSANAGKTIELIVNVDKAAEAKTYAVDVKFTYFNTDGKNYDSTSSIYFKVKNGSVQESVLLENISVEPGSLEIGGDGVINAVIRNRGPLNLHGFEVAITDIDPAAITVRGVTSKKIANFLAGTNEKISFNISSNSAMAAGNYPITFTSTGKNENGKEYTFVQKYYVSVGGSSIGKKSDLEITNLKEPGGTFGVNQNFNVSFNLLNKGDAAAKNVKVTAKEYGEGGNIVPKSSSVISVKEIAAGASSPINFTFAATGAATTRNYTVELVVEYEKNGKTATFSQYAGANVNNPDKKTEGDKKTSKPKIIVSEYSSNPIIVNAGEEFDLTMTFLNTHPQKGVKNVKMFLTMAAETSAETKSTGNIFTPVDSSNTFYFDAIPSKGTVNKKLRLYTVPDAQPKTYTLTVNFEYEDSDGTEFTATELLGINVKQTTKVETSEIAMPQMAEVFMNNNVYFDIINTGKVALSNLKVTLDGDIESTTKNVYIGNCNSGESSYYEGNFSVINEGINNVKVIISYDDPSGETITNETEYVIEGTPPMPMEPMGEEGMNPDGGGKMPVLGSLSTGKIIGIVAAALACIILLAVVLKRRSAKKAAQFIEETEDEIEEEATEAEAEAEAVENVDENNNLSQ